MSRWFRHYAGMMRDDKLVRVAIKSKQPIERILWIWGAILESAAEIDDNGRYDVDGAEIAYFLRADQDDIDAVLAGLADAGRVAEGHVVHWGARQFVSDRSAARVAAHRERKRAGLREGNDPKQGGNNVVTLQQPPRNSPELETELELEEEDPPTPQGEETVLLPEHVVEAWNAMAVRNDLALVKRLGPDRLRKLKARIRENTIEDFTEAIGAIERSRFLCEGNGKTWRGADFDFLLQPSSFTKLIEGSYDQPTSR